MCAFKHASNELLRAFNEQYVHLTILFQRLDDAHFFNVIKGYEILVLVDMNDQIHELFVYVAGIKSYLCKKVACMNWFKCELNMHAY